jgi:hypothetical protein
MTKDSYFEMCELMNTEPVESDIPVDFSDFPQELQQCFEIYNILQDNWDTMNGVYLGKNWTGIKEMLEMYQVNKDEMVFYLGLINLIDRVRKQTLNKKPTS